MRGYINAKDLKCSFYFNELDYSLKLIVPEDKINTRLMFDLPNGDFFDGITYVEGYTLDGEIVRFYFDWLNISNLSIDLRVTFLIKFDQQNDNNFGKHVNEHTQKIVFSGDIIDALYSPKHALKVNREDMITDDKGFVRDIKHSITELSFSEIEQTGVFKYNDKDTVLKFTVNKNISSEDSNYFQSYHSVLAIEFNKNEVFNIEKLINFYLNIQNLMKFIFRISDFAFRDVKFNLALHESGFIRYGRIFLRDPQEQGSINRRINFNDVFPVFPDLLTLFLKENIYLNHLSNNTTGYKYNDIPFLFSCFDSEFSKCYPEVDKKIDEIYQKDKKTYIELLDKNKNSLNDGEDSLYSNIKQFLNNNELSFGKKINHVILDSKYLITVIGGEDKIKEYSNRIREFRNSLIHGRKFKFDKPIDFGELLLFEKMNYYLIIRRTLDDEDKIKKFISTVFFAFEHNMIKKD